MKVVHVFSAPESVFFFMEDQLQYLKKSGYCVTVIMPKDEYYTPLIKEREIDINFKFVSLNRKVSFIRDLKSFFILLVKFWILNPDIIHLHTPKASFLGVLAARILRKKNIIYQMHGLVSFKGNAVWSKSLYAIEKMTCYMATQVFAVSKSLGDTAIKYGYCKKEKIIVIGNGSINGVDANHRFNPHKLSKLYPNSMYPDKFIIGFVGRLDKDKGFIDFLHVLKVIRETKKNIVGVIIGPDESKGLFLKTVEELGLISSVDYVWLGKQINPEKYMKDFDVLLFPSYREGFGLVAAEANALQVPVIAYDIPGVRDAIAHNQTGVLVSLGSTKQLEKQILQYYYDENLKNKHGLAGRKRVKKLFDRNKILFDLSHKYSQL